MRVTRRRSTALALVFCLGLLASSCGGSKENAALDQPPGDWHTLSFRLYWGHGDPPEGVTQRYVVRHRDLPVHVFVGQVELIADLWTPLVPEGCTAALGADRVTRARAKTADRGDGRLEVAVTIRGGSACPDGDDQALVPLNGYSPQYWSPVRIATWY